MRGATLLSLLTSFRSASRLSQNPAHNSQVRDAQVDLLKRVQEWLFDDYRWPHLRVERQVSVQAGQRFYAPPDDMHIDNIDHVEFRYGLEWLKLEYGIGAPQYTVWNSELDVRSWPVERWKIWEGEQIELWPIPASNADETTLDGHIKFIGTRNLRPLVADNDVCDLDDQIIYLFAAAEQLAADGKKDAGLKLSAAKKRYAKLTGRLSPSGVFRIGAGNDENRKRLRGPPRVQYRNVGG